MARKKVNARGHLAPIVNASRVLEATIDLFYDGSIKSGMLTAPEGMCWAGTEGSHTFLFMVNTMREAWIAEDVARTLEVMEKGLVECVDPGCPFCRPAPKVETYVPDWVI